MPHSQITRDEVDQAEVFPTAKDASVRRDDVLTGRTLADGQLLIYEVIQYESWKAYGKLKQNGGPLTV
jgi:hypothetical protein